MPGATEASLITLAEQALARGLEANLGFAELGLNMRLAVNISARNLAKVPVADIVADLSPAVRKMAGRDH